jgi:hypothetical protein
MHNNVRQLVAQKLGLLRVVSKHVGQLRDLTRIGLCRAKPVSISVAAWLQVELRVVAALAGEQALQEAFAAGRDVHEATARVLLDKQPGVSFCMLLWHSTTLGLVRKQGGCAAPSDLCSSAGLHLLCSNVCQW